MTTEEAPVFDSNDFDSWDDVEAVDVGIGEIVKFGEIGDFLVGIYQGPKSVVMHEGTKEEETVTAHTFIDRNGDPIAAWSCFELDQKLAGKEGYLCRVEYRRDIETKRGLSPMKSFKVQAKF